MKLDQIMKEQEEEAKRRAEQPLSAISEVEFDNESQPNLDSDSLVRTTYVLPDSNQSKVSLLEESVNQISSPGR